MQTWKKSPHAPVLPFKGSIDGLTDRDHDYTNLNSVKIMSSHVPVRNIPIYNGLILVPVSLLLAENLPPLTKNTLHFLGSSRQYTGQ